MIKKNCIITLVFLLSLHLLNAQTLTVSNAMGGAQATYHFTYVTSVTIGTGTNTSNVFSATRPTGFPDLAHTVSGSSSLDPYVVFKVNGVQYPCSTSFGYVGGCWNSGILVSTGGASSGITISAGSTIEVIITGLVTNPCTPGNYTWNWSTAVGTGAANESYSDVVSITQNPNTATVTGTDTRTECNSYTWIDGVTYTSSNNTATFTIVNGAANSCADSIVNLDLTIINSTSGTDTRTECNSYTWIDGVTYTSSNNTATFNIVDGANNGCDSLVNLDLTITNPTSIDTRTECNSYTWVDGVTYTSSNNTATFTIANGANNGCDSLVTLDLTINTVSDLTTTTSGITINANNTGANYQWLDCDNNYAIITGETGQSYTATANGNYAVELTENGCVDTSACAPITTVSILENNFENEIVLYPNPTDGNFSVDLGDIYNSVTVKMTDLTGKLIQSKEYNNAQMLNLKIVEPAGVYLIILESAKNKAIVRLVKE